MSGSGGPVDRASGWVLVTGNVHKLREAERILGVQLNHKACDLPEIQHLDLIEVLRVKADEAWRRVGQPLVVDETGLELSALNGFPGPLVKWLLQAVGAAGIAALAHRAGDPRVIARCALIYRDADDEILAEVGVEGRLVREPRGEQGFGWDPIFQPLGESRTYAEMSSSEKDRVGHRGRVWRRLQKLLGESGRQLG